MNATHANDNIATAPVETRWPSKAETIEMVNLFHLARTALSDLPMTEQSRWHRKNWAASEFCREHGDVGFMKAWKSLDRALSWVGP